MNNQYFEEKIVLAIGAHPDDIDIVAGGTISKWVNNKNEVHYCIVSFGDAGSPRNNLDNETGAIRKLEQKNAAERLGVHSVDFLGFPDGKIEFSLDLRFNLASIIRKIMPQVILTHSPNYNLNSIRFSHPDHLAVGQAVLAAIFPDARNPYSFPDTNLPQLAPHSVEEVWLMGNRINDTYEDITNHIEEKINAISCHESQLSDFGDLYDFFYTWGRELADEAGMPDNSLAEAYRRMSTI